MRNKSKLLVLPVIAILAASCSLFQAGGPLGSPFDTSTPDLAQTLTAMAPTSAPATVVPPTGAPATEAPTAAPPTVEPTTAVPPTSAPTVTNTTAPVTSGGVPVVPITPVSPYQPPTAVVNQPTAAPIGNRIRLNFLPDATSASVQGSINGGTTVEYVVRALGGQIMIIDSISPSQDVFLRIYSLATGQVFVDTSAQTPNWQGRLPATQDYVIALVATGGNTTYNMNVTIPENLMFSPGATSASRSYPIRAREVHTFLLRASQGQDMTMSLTPNDQSVLLAFYGYEDGQPYLRTVTGQTSWTGKVPATEDFVVQVVSVIDTATNFTLNVSIK